MRAANGKLIVAENGGGKISVITVNGDKASVAVIKEGLKTPTGVEPCGRHPLDDRARHRQGGVDADAALRRRKRRADRRLARWNPPVCVSRLELRLQIAQRHVRIDTHGAAGGRGGRHHADRDEASRHERERRARHGARSRRAGAAVGSPRAGSPRCPAQCPRARYESRCRGPSRRCPPPVAPSARLTPNSRVRWLTRNAVAP